MMSSEHLERLGQQPDGAMAALSLRLVLFAFAPALVDSKRTGFRIEVSHPKSCRLALPHACPHERVQPREPKRLVGTEAFENRGSIRRNKRIRLGS